ncbi:DUF3265 domain-containing protein [Vibrio mimicus]|nr:DUF3265 domain-containing protein [Vibrio mimicus]MBY7728720.1 DUF3265 domain-containing protein [Vibrio mimicus]
MTKRLRGIWHAWHFRFALGSVIKSLCGSFCSACLHPLTRRYVAEYGDHAPDFINIDYLLTLNVHAFC